jgi:fructose-bisphosphate aldolase class I
VPIVEPEILMDGNHTLQRCAEITETVLKEVFKALEEHKVQLEYILLKPNMVLPGKDCEDRSDPETIAEVTYEVLQRSVPNSVPSINFLSGGQSSEEATKNLNALNKIGNNQRLLSFSYGRALQEKCLKAWAGNKVNKTKAQAELFQRAKLNGLATLGKYDEILEIAD